MYLSQSCTTRHPEDRCLTFPRDNLVKVDVLKEILEQNKTTQEEFLKYLKQNISNNIQSIWSYWYKIQTYRNMCDQKLAQFCFTSHWPHCDIGSLIRYIWNKK